MRVRTRVKAASSGLLAILIVAAFAACGSGDNDGGENGELSGTVAINNSGGDINAVSEEHWWRPFTEETGVQVRNSAPADFTKLKAQVDSGNVIWDLAEIETGGQYLQAVEEGLIEKIDTAKLQKYADEYGNGDLGQKLLDGALESHAVWYSPYATVLVFDEREFPEGGPQPDSVDALWDFERFPGKRCISGSALYNIEIALHADGVTAEEMYPLDVDRALTKLDELKPEVAKFWREGAEPIQLVSSGECVMSTVWNGRPFAAQVLEGIDFLGIAWEGGILHTSRWVIPVGAPNREAAYAALGYFLSPEVGAGFGNEIAYPNVHKGVDDLLDAEAGDYVATTAKNFDVMTVQDDEWWFESGEPTEEAYAEWTSD